MIFCLWFGNVIILKDEILNSQWINTLSNFIFIQNKQTKKNVLGQLKAFITKKKVKKFICMKKYFCAKGHVAFF
jgi:hypothetical protein